MSRRNRLDEEQGKYDDISAEVIIIFAILTILASMLGSVNLN